MLYSILTAMAVILMMSLLLAFALHMAEKHGKSTHCQGRSHCGAGGCAGCSMEWICEQDTREARSAGDDPVLRIEGEQYNGTR